MQITSDALVLEIADEPAMVNLGKALAQTDVKNLTLYLNGNLGMGKTTFSRGVLQGFAHTGAVKSPTYTLVEPYEFADARVFHFDLYRLADPEELEYLGIRDYFAEQAIRLIEWPEKGQGLLPLADMTIDIESAGRGRRVKLRADTSAGQETLRKLSGLLHVVEDQAP